MIIASQKRKENIAEYLLYMWQIEDIIRANKLEIDNIKANIIDKFEIDSDQKLKITEWYESLIDMMRREKVERTGHLQLTKNVIIQLASLHQTLLNDPKYANYSASFYKTLPYIVELRAKAGEAKQGEIETCFTALYGILMLKLQGIELTPETQAASTEIAQFLAILSYYFKLDDEDKLFNQE